MISNFKNFKFQMSTIVLWNLEFEIWNFLSRKDNFINEYANFRTPQYSTDF
jgi:hypothetical protein